MKRLIVLFSALLVLGSAAVAQQGPNSQIELEVMQTEPTPLQAGEYADIWIRATNTGDSFATDPSFEVVEQYPFTPVHRSNWEPNGELGPGQSYDFRATVRVSETAVFGSNDLRVDVTGNGDTVIQEQLPVEVRSSDRSLVIESLDMPERIQPGTSAEMNLQLENMEEQQFRNVDVSLDVSEIPVATRETSRLRIESIDGKESSNVSFTIDADPDAENELYTLPITLEYENQAGDEFSRTETTGVNIGGYPDIQVGMESRDLYSPGSGTVTLRLINRGEGQAKFTQVEVGETDNLEIVSEDSVYLGTMIADDYQTAEFDVYTNSSEMLEIPVTVTYKDGEGEQTESFTVEKQLYSSGELSQYGLADSGGSWIPIVIGLVLVLAGAGYWRRRRSDDSGSGKA